MFNFWKKKSDIPSQNAISLVVQDGKFDVTITYNPSDPNAAEDLGKLLYCMNKGFLMQYFLEELNKTILNDPENSSTMVSVINSWNKFYETEPTNDPMIRPLSTFAKHVKK
jgi:hypothetical protein